jgi:peptidoglycan/LPS O-acetylase OafA/YrhL
MAPVRLSAVAGSRENNFDVLRLFAAGLVLFGHSFPLSGRNDPFHPHTIATVGVEIFFVISGFLVTKSWLSDPSFRRFLAKRVRRILPGLLCAVSVTAIVIGPIFGLAAPAASLHYAESNVLLLAQLPTLGRAFSSNPLHAVNGSLWTLPVEVSAYVYLAVFAVAGLLMRRAAVGVAVGVALALNAAGIIGPPGRLISLFVAGSVFYLLRDRIVLRPAVAAALAALWLAAFTTPLATMAGMVALPYLVAYIAYCTPRALKRVVSKGDVSYGFYLYAFPIQQGVIALLGPVPSLTLAAIAAPLAWLAGLASWRLVERPILQRRGAPRIRSVKEFA